MEEVFKFQLCECWSQKLSIAELEVVEDPGLDGLVGVGLEQEGLELVVQHWKQKDLCDLNVL